MEVAQELALGPSPTATDACAMVVEAGPDDLIETVAELPLPCLECASLGPVTRDGLCRTCAKLPVGATPTLLQLHPAPQLESEPPSKRSRKRSKPALYTPAPPRAAELAFTGSPPPAQLPDEILESIGKMVATPKPRTGSSPYLGSFYSHAFRRDSAELRVDERLTARHLANLGQVAKDWKRGVESVGWATMLEGIAEKCSTWSEVRTKQKDGNPAVTLQGMQAASATIVATKAAAEYKVTTEELRAKVTPFQVKRNPHRRSGQMRIYNTKDVLNLALAKHGGATGLRKKIEKCEATARKRAANGGARPGRKPRGCRWPSRSWDSDCDCDDCISEVDSDYDDYYGRYW